jgi:pimeloyl-ACP methyl ester carboxylesterase
MSRIFPALAHTWRSPLLGDARRAELPDGAIEYFDRGSGAPLVFVHGWLANANLWRKVVDRLHKDFRCIVLDLPLGGHRLPMPPSADLGPDGVAAIISSVLQALDLHDVTLVGNDSGGAYSQIAVARHTDRVGRLVLTSCETLFDQWPPPQFAYLCDIARDAQALAQAATDCGIPPSAPSPSARAGGS